MPLAPGRNGGKRMVANVRQRALFRIGPWHATVEITHHFPVRKQLLDSRCIGQLQWCENETAGLNRGDGFHSEVPFQMLWRPETILP